MAKFYSRIAPVEIDPAVTPLNRVSVAVNFSPPLLSGQSVSVTVSDDTTTLGSRSYYNTSETSKSFIAQFDISDSITASPLDIRVNSSEGSESEVSVATCRIYAPGSSAGVENFDMPAMADPEDGDVAIGELSQDAITPEQIALYLPFTGAVDADAVATVEYKRTVDTEWSQAQPLWRILPEKLYGQGPASMVDAFAGTIFGLSTGSNYDVRVTVSTDQNTAVREGVFSTRSLPASSGAATATATTEAALIAAVSAASAGDVIEFSGEIAMSGRWQIDNVNGTEARPITIRGDDRDTAKLTFGASGIQVVRCDYLTFENFTLQGSGVNAPSDELKPGFEFNASYNDNVQTGTTFRNLRIQGFDQGIKNTNQVDHTLIYDNIMQGNNEYTQAELEGESTWSDDGIRIGGLGAASFNNTLSGYGDAMSFRQQNETFSVNACYFYRNHVYDCGDDAVEAEYSQRNNGSYDNLTVNTMTALSLDGVYGGPYYHFRNRHVNIGRNIVKAGANSSGVLIYHNTFISTNGDQRLTTGITMEYMGQQGQPQGWEFVNNLMIWEGTNSLNGGSMWRFDGDIANFTPLIMTNNGWGRNNEIIQFANNGGGGDVAYMNNKFAPLFDDGVELTGQAAVFETPVDMGTSYLPAKAIDPTLDLSVTSEARNVGVELPNITSGT